LLSPQNTPVGTPIFIVNATDPDLGAGGSVLYSFQPPSQFFAIDSARGIVTVIRELDFETTQAYQLTVNATVSAHTHPAPVPPACLSPPRRREQQEVFCDL
jgi:protocadherin-15